MQFNSIDFMLFFPIVIAIYFIVPKKMRSIWLLISSYYFYMSWNALYAVLIASSTLLTYLSGLLISRFATNNKKVILGLCIIINLGILFIFKYGDFIIDSINSLLNSLHFTIIKRKFDFLLPVGISFYTFQALGYIIDVYRNNIDAEKNIVRYSLYVSFFPQLVAGPIERSTHFLPQLKNIEKIELWNARRVTSGAILMIWGFFMKMVIADRISLLVNTVFDNYRMYGSTELILAAVAFSIQIYCDFGSYSIIAIGCSRIMGFELMENFNTPYFACNIRDFWRRWHISLSTWFKEYLYIPLGGNRKGPLKKQLNTMLVFLTSGLWHGAAWNFVAWGGIHGLYHVIGDLFANTRKKIISTLHIKTDCFSYKLFQIIFTYCMVVFAWIFFRSKSIIDALRYIKRIFTKPTPWLLFNDGIYSLGINNIEMRILVFSLVLLLLVELLKYKRKVNLDQLLFNQNILFEWFVIITLILMIFIFGEYGPTFDPQQFIYFQF